ncbi:MAG: hypothetical protein ACRDY5_09275 [Acidimicrobiales bacterium]
MVSRPGGKRGGLPGEIKDLVDLVVAYARQETIEPLKGLARFAAFGLAGSLALSLGLVLLLLGGLRALQTETGTTFSGRWSWAPYLLTVVAASLLALLALKGRASKRSHR